MWQFNKYSTSLKESNEITIILSVHMFACSTLTYQMILFQTINHRLLIQCVRFSLSKSRANATRRPRQVANGRVRVRVRGRGAACRIILFLSVTTNSGIRIVLHAIIDNGNDVDDKLYNPVPWWQPTYFISFTTIIWFRCIFVFMIGDR